MSQLHARTRRIALALLVLVLPALGGCWPLAPIAGIVAAAGGGGGGGGGDDAEGLRLHGTIVTDSTVFDTAIESLDREPNDTLGFAHPIGTVAAATVRRIGGTTGLRATIYVATESHTGPDVLRRELLQEGESRLSAEGAVRPAAALARRGNELYWIDASEGRVALRVTPLVSSFVKRRLELALDLEPRGAAILLDALWILDGTGGGARLAAFDAEDGRPLFVTDLRRDGLAHLAGATELASGEGRLFTCDPQSGELFEVTIAALHGDRRVAGLRPAGTPRGLEDGIAALGYDGALLHVIDGGGTLRSLEPDTLREVATRPLLRADERARSLVAHFELGLDGYHVEVPADTTLAVELATTSDRGVDGSFFATAIERSTIGDEVLPVAPSLVETTGSPDLLRLELSAPADAPKGFDVIVGARTGSGRYVLAFGGRAYAPRNDVVVERDEAAAALAAHVESAVIAPLSGDRLSRLYRDPLMPEFAPDRLVLGRDATTSLVLPAAPKGFTLRRLTRSPSGFDVVELATTAEYAGPAVRTLHGVATRASERREQARAVLAALDGIAGTPGLRYAEPDYVARTLAQPNDPGFTANQQWHYDLLNLQNAWDIETGTNSTVMAVVDTGSRDDNVDFAANLGVDGYDFVTGNNAGDGDGRDPDPFDEGTFAGVNGNGHHGSHVGGTMGAQGNNNLQGTGICWDCTLMPVRALGTDGSGFVTDIADGVRYAARLNNASGTLPSVKAQVINLSLGLSAPNQTLHNALIDAVNEGCIVMCAAGNDGNGVPVLYPAAFDEAIAIAAADHTGGVAFYSNSGPEIDATCSGGAATGGVNDIWSTVGVGVGGSLQPLAGTSMAAAHASGIAGLMVTVNPAIDQDDARTILTTSAVDIEAAGFDDLSGFGLVDAAAAVNQAPPTLFLSDDEVDFGNTGTHLAVQALNIGGGDLAVSQVLPLTSTDTPTGVPPTTAWLTATLLADGKTIQLVADRTTVANGDYQAQVGVTSNGGNGSFLVDVTVGLPTVSNIGEVEVWIFDIDGTTFLKGTTADFADDYAWTIANIPRGDGPRQYFVVAGVDIDQDLVIGEPGEPFGAYPDANAPQPLELDQLSTLQLDLVVE